MDTDPSKPGIPRTSTLWLCFGAAALALAVMVWSNDSITPEDVWTLYTARCEDGSWQAKRCTGRLVAAERYRFVTDRAKGEVHFKVMGDAGVSSGKLSGCTIEDDRNWTCMTTSAGPRPLIRQLACSQPVVAPEGPGHARLVSKRTWYLLHFGIPVRSEASM
jgi:hypothetical protein